MRGDAAGAARMEELAKTIPEGELRVLDQQAEHAAALGQVGRMRELRAHAVERGKAMGISDFAANQLVREADADAELGYAARASADIDSALLLSREPSSVADAADAASAAGKNKNPKQRPQLPGGSGDCGRASVLRLIGFHRTGRT